MKEYKIDIVLAKKSKHFLWKAKELGFSDLIFALPYQENLNLNSIDAVIIKTDSLKELRKQINIAKKKNKKPIIIATNDILRQTFENKQTFIVMPELNHVLCNLAKKNDITIVIDFSSIRKSVKEKAIIIEKILRIVRLCRKYKTKMMVASFSKKPEEMISARDMHAFACWHGLNYAI
jgi:RNase P/RNase MRP subunit p30